MNEQEKHKLIEAIDKAPCKGEAIRLLDIAITAAKLEQRDIDLKDIQTIIQSPSYQSYAAAKREGFEKCTKEYYGIGIKDIEAKAKREGAREIAKNFLARYKHEFENAYLDCPWSTDALKEIFDELLRKYLGGDTNDLSS